LLEKLDLDVGNNLLDYGHISIEPQPFIVTTPTR